MLSHGGNPDVSMIAADESDWDAAYRFAERDGNIVQFVAIATHPGSVGSQIHIVSLFVPRLDTGVLRCSVKPKESLLLRVGR